MLGWLAKQFVQEKHIGVCCKCQKQLYQTTTGSPQMHRRDCCSVNLCSECHFNIGDQYGGSPKEYCPCCRKKTGGEVAEFWAMIRKNHGG